MFLKALLAKNTKAVNKAGGETVGTNIMKKSKEYIEHNVDCTKWWYLDPCERKLIMYMFS